MPLPTLAVAAAALEAFGAAGRPFWMPIHGTSMLPFLREGDAVRVTAAAPRLGDLAAFWEGGQVIVHRCAGWGAGGAMRQKGDNLPGWSYVPAPRLIGRVDRCRRAGEELALGEGWGLWWSRALGLRAQAACALWSLRGALRARVRP